MITVILPVYNMANYVGKCIESLRKQLFSDFELIIVDDGSTDRSGEIADNYAVKDTRIRVLHKKNGGVSEARNLGMSHAEGDWITFVDADDIVGADYLNNFMAFSGYDLIAQGFCEIGEDGKREFHTCRQLEIIGEDPILKLDTLAGDYLERAVTHKLFRKSLIVENGIRFDKRLTMGEDFLFVLDYMNVASKIVFVDKVDYYYVRHSDSACGRDHSYFSHVVFLNSLGRYFDKYGYTQSSYVRSVQKEMFNLQLDTIRLMYKQSAGQKEIKDFIGNVRSKVKKLPYVADNCGHKNKVLTLMIRIMPVFFLVKVLHIIRKFA